MADNTNIIVPVKFDAIELAIMNDLDAKLWFDDLMDRIIQGRFPSAAYDRMLEDRVQEEADIHQVGYEEGWSDRDDEASMYSDGDCPEDCCRE